MEEEFLLLYSTIAKTQCKNQGIPLESPRTASTESGVEDQ
jgi:hypothetical protein